MMRENCIISLEFGYLPASKSKSSPYYFYFNHMLLHFASFKRMTTLYQKEQHCCFKFGYMNKKSHEKLSFHCFCDTTKKNIKMLNKNLNCECNIVGKITHDTVCNVHNIAMQNIKSSDKYFYWTIGLINDITDYHDDNNDILDYHDDKNQNDVICFQNPSYNVTINNGFINDSYDSIEIHFSDDYKSEDNLEVIFDVGTNLQYDQESLIYETSDDESDLDDSNEIFIDPDVAYQLACQLNTTKNSLDVDSEFLWKYRNKATISRQDELTNFNIQNERHISKYHQKCLLQRKP